MPSRRSPGTHASREEVAELVVAWIARHHGKDSAFDANHLGKLERGTVRRPSSLVRAALCAVYDATEADLGFAPTEAADRVSAALRGRTDVVALDAVASVLGSLRRLEDVAGAAEVVPSVRRQAALVDRLARNASGDARSCAVGLLSEIEQYLGWLAIPLGQWGESRRHLDRATVLAIEADDSHRLVTALSFAADRSLRRHDVRTADALNEAAARNPRSHPALRTYLAYQRADVLARGGDRTEAARQLGRADQLVDRLPGEVPESGYWYTPSFFTGERAFVLHALDDRQGARRAAADALAAMPATWRGEEWEQRRRELAELAA